MQTCMEKERRRKVRWRTLLAKHRLANKDKLIIYWHVKQRLAPKEFALPDHDV
jgi:hypothetical protein